MPKSDASNRVLLLAETLLARGLMLVTAESCTGGLIAKTLTDLPGSSRWFERGYVTYSNQAKQELLGVSAEILQQHGAVSEATVRAMAEGAVRRSHAQLSIAVSGVAGPDGGTVVNPVGSVWLAWAQPGACRALHFQLRGDREAIRLAAMQAALDGALSWLQEEGECAGS